MEVKTGELNDERTSRQFYDDRYTAGYMDEWPPEKQDRVLELIQSLGLPPTGNALDFGCGNGVFTDVVHRALPGWKVFGTDISDVALVHAQKRVPSCTFFAHDDEIAAKKFDFLFTHHVLEHVYDLPAVWRQIIDFMKPGSTMLHILPCGNEGSLEQRLSLMMIDGIDADGGHRFFFEDTGHLRRLNTEQARAMAAESGFELAEQYYANQQAGSIEWITRTELSFVSMMIDPTRVKESDSRAEIRRLRNKLMVITFMRTLLDRARSVGKRKLSAKGWSAAVSGLAFYPVLSLVDRYMKRRAQWEWQHRKTDPGGSEMYLCFTRRAN